MSALLLALLVGCSLAACSGDETGRSAEPSGKSAAASDAGSADAANDWIAHTDAPTGVRFLLPQTVEPEERAQALADGTPAQTRLYQVALDEAQLVVSFITADSDLSTFNPRDSYRIMVASFKQVGADDAKLSHVSELEVEGLPAVDATLSFTSLKEGEKNYWRLRTIVSSDFIVQIQALTFASPDELAAASRAVDANFDQLVDGIQIK